MRQDGLTKEEYEEYSELGKAWNLKKDIAIKKLKRSAGDTPINLIMAQINAIKLAKFGKEEFDIVVKNVEGEYVKLHIKI